MPIRHVALIRGINVGKAKRVAMADLRALIEELGYRDVQTLLNSGNVVFTADRTVAAAACSIQDALASRLGTTARVTVLTARQLADVVSENPLTHVGDNPSRLLVTFLAKAKERELLEPLLRQDWTPEAIAVGARVVYLWCPEGVLASRASQAVGKILGDGVTTRNWATVLKLHALIQG